MSSFHIIRNFCVCHFLTVVLSSLRLLSTTTAILTDPSLLPEQATLAVTQGDTAAAPDTSLQLTTWDNVHPMWPWRTDSVELKLEPTTVHRRRRLRGQPVTTEERPNTQDLRLYNYHIPIKLTSCKRSVFQNTLKKSNRDCIWYMLKYWLRYKIVVICTCDYFSAST